MLQASNVRKSYGSVRALDGVSIDFAPHQIHAVLGENGAGKSTLMHVIAGFAVPDAGTVTLDGDPIPVGLPFECRRLGIAMIHQHFTLVPAFTVEENLALARLRHMGPLDTASLAAAAMEHAQNLGWSVPRSARAGDLPVGTRQRIEILKAIAEDARVVVFDEPTAVLGADEVEDLFRVLRRLRDSGKVVILIAHKLSEIMSIADRVTVLRQGKVVGETDIAHASLDQLALWMVGDMPASIQGGSGEGAQGGLRVAGLTARGDRGEDVLRGIDLSVERGQIIGIGGVDGNGQVELAETLAGIRKHGGTIEFSGSRTNRIAYIPQDRQTDGLALGMSVEDNLLIVGHRKPELRRGPFFRMRKIRGWVRALMARFDIRAASPAVRVGDLSGGNQQKVVVARALETSPDLLIAVNPTRGLDVRATNFVHSQILAVRDAGGAVVLISTDRDELAELSTRTVSLSRGRIVEEAGSAGWVGGVA